MSELSPRIAVYPGSFDPITLGHLNVMERASRLFERLIVGIGINIEKQAMFEPEEREQLVALSTSHLNNIEIRAFSGLAVEFVKFLIGPEGQAIMEQQGQPPVVPPVTGDVDAVPAALQSLVE